VSNPDGWAGPVTDDRLVLAADHDVLIAFSSGPLDPEWRFPPLDAEIREPAALYGTPAMVDGAVYVPTYDRDDLGSVHKLRLDDGIIEWSFENDAPILGSVAATSSGVYFGDNDGRVFALDPESGEEIWSFETGDRIWSMPAIVGDALLVTSLDGNLYAIDIASGDEIWFASTDAGIAASPVVDETAGRVYVAGLDSHVRAIELETGREIWSFKGGNAFWSTPVLATALYVADSDGNVNALDTESGSPAWDSSFTTENPVRSATIVADGSLIVIDREGNVHQIDPANGESLGEVALEADVLADPTTLNDVLLVVTTGGELIQVATDQLAEIDRRSLG
jgi:outer membrane protein assembly factor BamB